jgi:hypothetical protein
MEAVPVAQVATETASTHVEQLTPWTSPRRRSTNMARSEQVPVRSGSEESAELFPGRDSDVSFDKSDPVNDRAWKGAGEKYSPQEPTSNLNMEAINQRAAPKK